MSNTAGLVESTSPITKALVSTALTLEFDDLIQEISLSVISGTCTVQGPARFRNAASDALTLSAGAVLTIPAKGPNAPIVGLIITAIGGTTNLIMIR